MIALIQRVSHAAVQVEERCVGEIGPGLLALIGVQRDDDASHARRILDKLLAYRVFPDEAQRMNRSLSDTGDGLLLVSQFTLAADTKKGTRPSFTPAAPPEEARELFDHLCDLARTAHPTVETGEFGADMQVSLVNDGPVTFWLEV
ncbi:D-aminoacyl-tRNA deacylase [Uliginosibacterium sp. 31-16]|uniref:D-aminoacyl-tRNA deacylase n=1 Tax=Uliginosibacterium sp. 31-16 TaxID=3068315 RepID=UPI00273E7D33|nr:D-aminoacyl-tRNA deacylase [Uliginosibacterium sp. 31-16]MDP5240601.1 D-aminoacyl-tRNA deacylase [Uliginosibacterium sp. 31-16]